MTLHTISFCYIAFYFISVTFLGHNKLDTKLDVLRLATAEIEEQSEVCYMFIFD